MTNNFPQGIDVSNHQGNIDWAKVAQSGKTFAFIKATEGTSFVDPYFAQNRAGAKAHGILPGGYHYFRPGVDPIAQANLFCKTLGSVPAGELQPVLDIEERADYKPSELVREVLLLAEHVKVVLQKDPIIYTYPYFWQYAMADSQAFHAYALWIATYGAAPKVVGGWPTWSFWQWDDHGRCPGVGAGVSDCDMNYFQGDLAHLRKFAGL